MASLGPYAAFIVASYALAAVVIAGLLVWLVRDGQRHQRSLASLEARGIRRRSAEDAD